MLSDLKILQTSSAMASHAAQRHAVIAGNIANANTPGYVAKDVRSFSEVYQTMTAQAQAGVSHQVQTVDVAASHATTPNGNSVAVEEQMMLSSQTKADHDMALAIYKKTLDMMKLAVGKKPLNAYNSNTHNEGVVIVSNPLTSAMSASGHGMNAQAFRIRVVSENLSNADTHGYQRKLVSFQNGFDALSQTDLVKIGDVTLDRKDGQMLYEPSHPLADAEGYVAGSNVEMMIELADAREASRSYEANLSTFRQATQMYSSLIALLQR